MKYPYPCIESTLDFASCGYRVRVWINEQENAEVFDNSELKQEIRTRCVVLSQHELAEWIAAQPRVNAVQVFDAQTGNGRVLYVNWP